MDRIKTPLNKMPIGEFVLSRLLASLRELRRTREGGNENMKEDESIHVSVKLYTVEKC